MNEDVKTEVLAALEKGHKASSILRPIFSKVEGDPAAEYKESSDDRTEACLFLLETVEDPALHSTLCSDLVDVLLTGIDSLSSDGLTSVCQALLDIVKSNVPRKGDAATSAFTSDGSKKKKKKNQKPSITKKGKGSATAVGEDAVREPTLTGKAFEVMPKVLSRLEVLDKLADSELATGTLFKNFFLNKLCNLPWAPQIILPLADAFKMITFSEEQSLFATQKLLRCLSTIGLDEVPPLVYQLLLLSAKYHRTLIITHIISFCNAKLDDADADADADAGMDADRLPSPEIISTIGTILMHFTFALKQNQDLAKDLAKLMKKGVVPFSTFTLATALCVMQLPRFQQPIQASLKGLLCKHAEDAKRIQHSIWLSLFQSAKANPKAIFKRIVSCSRFGWDQIVAPLLELAFFFLDISKTSPVLAEVGVPVVEGCFAHHPSSRMFVVEEIITRLISRSVSDMSAYLLLFKSLIASHVAVLGDGNDKIRDVLDYLVFLPFEQSVGTLRAISPLLGINERLKDATILALRKALFNRSLDARLLAVHGFIDLLQQSHDDIFIAETIGNLRRCFSQQLSVRVLLYQKIAELVAVRPDLAPLLSDMLSRHLRTLTPASLDTSPPFFINAVVREKGVEDFQQDSMGWMLEACMAIVAAGAADDDIDVSDLPAFVPSFVARMSRSDVEDYELDAAANFSGDSETSRRNIAIGLALVETFDACVNYVAAQPLTIERCQQIVMLIRKRLAIVMMMKDGLKKHGPVPKLISLKTLNRLFAFMLDNDNADNAACRSVLHGKVITIRFLLECCQDQINKEPLLPATQQLVCTLFQELILPQPSAVFGKLYQDRKNKGQRLPVQMRHILKEYIDTLSTLSSKGTIFCDEAKKGAANSPAPASTSSATTTTTTSTTTAMTATVDVPADKETAVENQHLHPTTCMASLMENFVMAIHSAFPSAVPAPSADAPSDMSSVEAFLKWVEGVAGNAFITAEAAVCGAFWLDLCFTVITTWYPSHPRLIFKVHNLIKNFCLDGSKVDDASLVKAMVSQLLSIDNKGEAALHLAQDNQIFIGTLEEGESGSVPQQQQVYGIITKKVADSGSVVLLTMEDLEARLDDMSWAFSQLTGLVQALSSVAGGSAALQNDDAEQSSFHSQVLPDDASIYERFLTVIVAVDDLFQTNFEKKVLWTRLFKLGKKVFETAMAACKHLLAKVTKLKDKSVVAKKFQDAIHFIAKNFSRHVYTAMSFLNESIEFNSGKQKMSASEARIIPNLVYAMEQFDRHVIMLEKKTNSNLMKHMKRSTARDFRISAHTIQAVMAQNKAKRAHEETMSNAGDGDDEVVSSESEAEDNGDSRHASNSSSSSGGGGKRSGKSQRRGLRPASQSKATRTKVPKQSLVL